MALKQKAMLLFPPIAELSLPSEGVGLEENYQKQKVV